MRDQERRTRLYDSFPFLQEHYTEEGATKIADWALKQNIQDFPDKFFGAFVWGVVESKDHNTLVETQRFFSFLHTEWTNVGRPSLYQVAARKILDNNVYATGVDNERRAWERFCKEKLIGKTKASTT